MLFKSDPKMVGLKVLNIDCKTQNTSTIKNDMKNTVRLENTMKMQTEERVRMDFLATQGSL